MNAVKKTMAIGSLIAVLWLSLPQSGRAHPLGAPAPAKTPADLKALEARAAAGDVRAQVDLGAIYYDGKEGVQPDDSKAVALFSRAAQAGSLDGQMAMGMAYEYGRGVRKDSAQAAAWYERAAAGDQRHAKYRLALLLDDGQPVPVDDPGRAVVLLRSAAEAGDAEAQNDLGWRYERGKGIKQDLSLAGSWYTKAAFNGSTNARANLGYLAELGLGQAEDHVMAAHFYEQAAAEGNAWAQYRLGRMMVYGQGAHADVRRGMDLMTQASEKGLAEAYYELALIKEEGHLVPQDIAAARVQYMFAAEKGHALAQFKLGYVLRTYEPKNMVWSVEWTRKAAEQNVADAQNNLGVAYQHGEGVTLNWAWAVYWYAKAAQQGHAMAVNNLTQLLPKRERRQVAATGANLRAKPELAAEILDTLPKGTIVYPIDKTLGDWHEVYVPAGHRLGYLAVSTLAPPPTPSVARRPAALQPASSGPWPARPAARPGVQTCNTRCNNGDCYRVYGDGRKVHFQAPRKFNPISSKFEWDSGGC